MKKLALFILLALVTSSAFASSLSEAIIGGLNEKHLVVARRNLTEYKRRASIVLTILKKEKKTSKDRASLLLILRASQRSARKIPSRLSFLRTELLEEIQEVISAVEAKDFEGAAETLRPIAKSVLMVPAF